MKSMISPRWSDVYHISNKKQIPPSITLKKTGLYYQPIHPAAHTVNLINSECSEYKARNEADYIQLKPSSDDERSFGRLSKFYALIGSVETKNMSRAQNQNKPRFLVIRYKNRTLKSSYSSVRVNQHNTHAQIVFYQTARLLMQ